MYFNLSSAQGLVYILYTRPSESPKRLKFKTIQNIQIVSNTKFLIHSRLIKKKLPKKFLIFTLLNLSGKLTIRSFQSK